MARLTDVAAGDAKARAEDDLTRVIEALAAPEAEVARLAVERTSLLLDKQGQGSHGGRLPESLGVDFCLWLQMLCV